MCTYHRKKTKVTRKITPTKPKHYYKTPTPTKCSQRIPPANSKTNSSPFSKILNKQEASPPTNTNSYIPQVQSPSKIYGLPKVHKTGTPLRPIVSSRGSITYGVAKELTHIIKPLVGQSPDHLKNTQHFIQQLQGKRLQPGEVITSFDVKALFTSVPVQPPVQIVKQRLQQDNTLPQRTSMSIPQITSLLEFCLTHTYFLFQGKYYEQVQGAAIGSPISPLIANIFMEEFEVKALNSIPYPLHFGSGLLMTPLSSTRQNTVRTYFSTSTTRTHTYNSQWNQHNKAHFHFWTLLSTIEPDNTFSTTVYRKPTHTDQYLHWDSNHHITAKQSVLNTLAHRAKIVSPTQDKMDRELQHIKTALQHCQFPSWALNQWQYKFTHPIQHTTTTTTSTSNNNSPAENNRNKVTIVVPYIPNTDEKFKKLCKK